MLKLLMYKCCLVTFVQWVLPGMRNLKSYNKKTLVTVTMTLPWSHSCLPSRNTLGPTSCALITYLLDQQTSAFMTYWFRYFSLRTSFFSSNIARSSIWPSVCDSRELVLVTQYTWHWASKSTVLKNKSDCKNLQPPDLCTRIDHNWITTEKPLLIETIRANTPKF